jgi:hypothetical protein
MINKESEMESITMPAGRYYIGDLCYVMHKEWDEACDLFFAGRSDMGCNQGAFKLADGRQFVNFNTAYGDGTYYDVDRRYEFGVDSGSIGCIKVEDIREELPDDAVIVEFKHDFECERCEGLLMFGGVHVETDPSFEEDEYEGEEEDEFSY